MLFEIENPFSDYGDIISGKYFIGRKKTLSTIAKRVFSPRPGNLAIIGLPRIGKSSVITHAIKEIAPKVAGKNFLAIWLNLATYHSVSDLFHSFVTECMAEINRTEISNSTIERAYKAYRKEYKENPDSFESKKHFFACIRSQGIRTIFVLDEFDYARHLFKNNPVGFQRLREIAYNPQHRVTFITASRRSIHHIEIQASSISTFDGIFHKLYLDQFEDEDMAGYYAHLANAQIAVTDDLKKKISYFTGNHPYLLAMLGFEIVEASQQNTPINMDNIASQTSASFRPYYDQIINLLLEDHALVKLIQLLFGPNVDVTANDIDEFLKFGLIQENPDGSHVAFSPHFQSYLLIIKRSMENEINENARGLWHLWTQTEKALRFLITQQLQNTYGTDWFDQLEKKYPKWRGPNGKTILQRCREDQQKELSNWGERASKDLLDFTYTGELFQIIMKEWDTASFKSIFLSKGKDKSHWEKRGQFLAQIRNPLAHNREEVLSNATVTIAEGYCKEILETLQNATKQ